MKSSGCKQSVQRHDHWGHRVDDDRSHKRGLRFITFAQLERNPEVYYTMNGPSEFHVTGTIKDWNMIGRLGEIEVPTLVTAGEFDEATPGIVETVHNGIRGSELITFKDCSRMTFVEKPAEYIRAVDDFLNRVEASGLREVTAQRAGRRRPFPFAYALERDDALEALAAGDRLRCNG